MGKAQFNLAGMNSRRSSGASAMSLKKQQTSRGGAMNIRYKF